MSKRIVKIKFFIILLLFSLIIIYIRNTNCLSYFSNYYNFNGQELYKFSDNETKRKIYHIEKFDLYKTAYNNAKDFINLTINGLLINNNKIKLMIKPKISVIIPCYNCNCFILRSIRSIQNQNFSNFEIIIVNDFSDFDNIIFLEKLKNEDQRIRVISNKKNMGTLYTRTIGTLAAKGKYIFPIDSDDMFLDKDVFSTVIKIADNGNFDITIFNSITTDLEPNVYSANISVNSFEKYHRPNLVLFQPELGYYPIAPNSNNESVEYVEELIFAKCIKTDIYKKAINRLGKERYSRYMVLGEDDIANYIIFNTAKIGKFIPKYGYIYINRKGSISRVKCDILKRLIIRIYILDVVIEFSKELIKNKRVLINYIFFLLKNKNLKDALISNDYDYKLFISCINRILNCKYISNETKNVIIKRSKSLDFIK